MSQAVLPRSAELVLRSEDDKMNHMVSTSVLSAFDRIFDPQRYRIVSTNAFIEFCRLHVSDQFATETKRILERAHHRRAGETIEGYAGDLLSAVQNVSDAEKSGNCDIDVLGARRFLHGYFSANDSFLLDRIGSSKKCSESLSLEAMESRLESMTTMLAETESVITRAINACYEQRSKSLNASNR